MTEFHHKIVPELKQAEEGKLVKISCFLCFCQLFVYIFSGKYKIGFERVIRAVVNYVRALPSVEDHEAIAKDVFGPDLAGKFKLKLRDAVKYFHRGTREGHVKPKHSKKAKNDTIKLASEEKQQNNSSNKKESDLVERIALDLDQLDLSETVEKVKQELNQEEHTTQSLDLVQALASGADVAPSADGKYPHETKESPKSIHIPQPHFEVKKTAIERHRLGQMSPLIYQLLTKGRLGYKYRVVSSRDFQPSIRPELLSQVFNAELEFD